MNQARQDNAHVSAEERAFISYFFSAVGSDAGFELTPSLWSRQ
jgi:hypothetical protein